MSKRSASTDLNHDNWDEDDEKETAGTFVPVTGSKLQNRVIRKAKRVLNKDSQSGQAASSQAASSPFAAFAGFSSNATSTPFSFLSKNSSSNDATTNNLPPTSFKPSHQDKNGEPSLLPQKKTETIIKLKEEKTVVKSLEPKAVEKKPTRSLEYYRQLQSLNESILKWMQLHLSKNACCDFTPVFNDYNKHMDTLNVTYPIKADADATLPTDIKSSDFFKRCSESKQNDSKKLVDAPKKSANNQDEVDEESVYGARFKSNTTNTSTFSFGIQSTPTATSSISSTASSSKEGEAMEQQEKKIEPDFSFGYFSRQNDSSKTGGESKPFTFATGSAGKSENTEEQEYVPPKNEFVAIEEEGAIYSKRCKLFFKKGEEYSEKGVGTLYVKSLDCKTQLLIRADTNLGNILLNIMLSASLPMSRTGKNNVLIVCIPNPPLDAKNPDSKTAIPILIRVKTTQDADELLEILNKHKS